MFKKQRPIKTASQVDHWGDEVHEEPAFTQDADEGTLVAISPSEQRKLSRAMIREEERLKKQNRQQGHPRIGLGFYVAAAALGTALLGAGGTAYYLMQSHPTTPTPEKTVADTAAATAPASSVPLPAAETDASAKTDTTAKNPVDLCVYGLLGKGAKEVTKTPALAQSGEAFLIDSAKLMKMEQICAGLSGVKAEWFRAHYAQAFTPSGMLGGHFTQGPLFFALDDNAMATMFDKKSGQIITIAKTQIHSLSESNDSNEVAQAPVEAQVPAAKSDSGLADHKVHVFAVRPDGSIITEEPQQPKASEGVVTSDAPVDLMGPAAAAPVMPRPYPVRPN